MSVRIAIAAFVLTLLLGGALAVAPKLLAAAESHPSRTTVIEKNQLWPVKGLITTDPCAVRACQEV